MKVLPKMDISEELDAQINENIKISELCKADVIRQALRIGLPQLAATMAGRANSGGSCRSR
jgi:hypothetical protein